MALPSFVENATSLDDGMANKLAGNLSKLRIAQSSMNDQLADVEETLAGVDGNNLPALPTLNDIGLKATDISALVDSKLGDLSALNDLTGGCFDTALGASNDIANDAIGFVGDLLADFANVANTPSQMADIFGLYGKAQEFANSLGIDQLIADMNGLLGCDSASSSVDDVNNEVIAIMNQMGLDSSGKADPDSYYAKMKSDMTAMANDPQSNVDVPVSFVNEMSDGLGAMTTTANEQALKAKNEAAAQIATAKANIKASIPATPTPPSFF